MRQLHKIPRKKRTEKEKSWSRESDKVQRTSKEIGIQFYSISIEFYEIAILFREIQPSLFLSSINQL